MPHQCTDCGRTFDDGSTEMLSGCPDCGGNKFQYQPADADPQPAGAAPDPPEPQVDSSVARTVGDAATTLREFVSSPPDSDSAGEETSAPGPADSGPTDDSQPHDSQTDSAPDRRIGAEAEDSAQASARTDVVSREDLPPAPETTADSPATNPSSADAPGADPTPTKSDPATETEERPGLEQLREELNDQFESIKVLEPGQYELNLMELYDREEYIIALQEDGKYTIQVPDRWKDD